MPRFLFAALLVLFFPLSSFSATLPQLLAASPKIQTEGGHGSGTVIAPGLIITAYHVVDGKKDIRAEFAGGQSCPAKLRSRVGDDIAILTYSKACNPGAFVAKLACRKPVWGEPLRAIGNPANVEFALIQGYVMSPAPDPVSGLIALNLGEVPGMSGGGVFDAKGNLLGVSDAMGMLPFGEIINSRGEVVSGLAIPLPTGIGLMVPTSDFCDEVRAEFLG